MFCVKNILINSVRCRKRMHMFCVKNIYFHSHATCRLGVLDAWFGKQITFSSHPVLLTVSLVHSVMNLLRPRYAQSRFVSGPPMGIGEGTTAAPLPAGVSGLITGIGEGTTGGASLPAGVPPGVTGITDGTSVTPLPST